MIGNAAGADSLPFIPRLPDTARYFQGRFVYERNCTVCHGPRGNGAGPMAGPLIPKPRSFRSGIFKYRTTPPGALPTNADLANTIRHGVPNTSMPIFDKLNAADVSAVIEYIKFFSPRWRDTNNYAPPMRLPETPTWMFDEVEAKRRAAGGGLVFRAACVSCHGEDGSGNGPAATTLFDDWGEPIKPASLRHPSLRCGSEPNDIYRVLMNGVAGTPMPSFAETTTEEQRWALVAYVEQLKKRPTKASAP